MTKKPVFLLFGMQRSGNHAIKEWLLAKERFTFYNDVLSAIEWRETGENPLSEVALRHFLVSRYRSASRTFLGRQACRVLSDKMLYMALVKTRRHLITFEDIPFGLSVLETGKESQDVYRLLLLRDPRNLFASRIRKAFTFDRPQLYPREIGKRLDELRELWMENATAIISSNSSRTVPVIFDLWFSSRRYREGLSTRLGCSQIDAGKDSVSDTFGGSSFDGLSYDGNASSMNVLNRSSQLGESERKLFDYLFEDGELAALWTKVIESVERYSERDDLTIDSSAANG